MRQKRMSDFRGATRVLALAALVSAATAALASERIFVPPDGIGTSGDGMGIAVALSGDTAAVGIPQGRLSPLAAPGAIGIFRDVAGEWQREAFLGPGLASAFALQQDMLVVGGDHVTTFIRNGSTWSQHDVLAVSGGSVALSDDTLLVASTPAGVYTRVNDAWTLQATLPGDQQDETIIDVVVDGDNAAIVGSTHFFTVSIGYVHFYHRSGTSWTLESTITAGGGLGQPVVPIAISGDTVLVATSEVDAYVRGQGTWAQEGVLDPLVAYSPGSVAIDGDRAIVGSPGDSIPGVPAAGTAYVFERTGGIWSRTEHLADLDAVYGEAFATSIALEGDLVLAGAPGAVTDAGQAGNASVIDLGTSPWSKVATLDDGNAHANERFGTSFGASGATLVAGAPNADIIQYLPQGTAYVFGLAPGGWTLEAELQAPSTALYGFGTSAAASGATVVVGSPDDSQTGAAFVYTRGDGSWPETARLEPDDSNTDAFGEALAFDGDRIAVGAPRGHGSAYLYTGSGSSWPEEEHLVPSASSDGDSFGSSLALDGDTILVGAPGANVDIEVGAGLAFVFVNTGSGWVEQAALEAPLPLAGAGFGASVALRGDTALVGTYYAMSGAQHVCVFRRTGTLWSLETTLDFDGAGTESYVGALAISDDENMIAIGMPTQAVGSGRVMTYVRVGAGWQVARTFVDDGPGNPGGVDGFGSALKFLGDSLLVGAPQDGFGGAIYEFGVGDPIFAAGFDPVP
jgi:hypothetical protein